jgi:hypothetical protein
MSQDSIVVIGLPGSGKTTFLAALWQLVFSRNRDTQLKFASLARGNYEHLNSIAARWRNAQMQERTLVGGNKIVSINMRDQEGRTTQITFPDVAGEAYRHMWENRECEVEVSDTLRHGNVLLFIHANDIKLPLWIADIAAQTRALNLPPESEETPVSWQPHMSPTQVQVVGLLSLLASPPLDIGPRRIVVMLSAWDKVKDERLSPIEFLRAKLPLLHQYLTANKNQWEWKVCGVSAQGGDYDEVKDGAVASEEARDLRALDDPTARIHLSYDDTELHDLTAPLAWLMK